MRHMRITKLMTAVIMAIIALIFASLGYFRLGFWDRIDGPGPGFFPAIMATVMLVTSIIAFIRAFNEEESSIFTKDELLVIVVTTGFIAAIYIIGLILAVIFLIVSWMKIIEKTSWGETIIVLFISLLITIPVFKLWLGIQFPTGIFGI